MSGKNYLGAPAREEKRKRAKAEKLLKEKRRIPEADKALAQAFLKKLPREVTVDEVKTLASVFNRHPEVLRQAIEAAREAFITRATVYVEKHLDSVRAAYAAGEFDTAARHAEWAIEHLGTKEGMLLEKPEVVAGPGGGPRVMVGVKIGGIRQDDDDLE